MKRFALLAVLAVGCGPSFEGTFKGPMSTFTICSNGQQATGDPFAAIWAIADNGDALDITSVGDICGNFAATPAGNRAKLLGKTCPPLQVAPGTTGTIAITDGQLVIDGDHLSVGMVTSLTLSGAQTGSCTQSIAGEMTRLQ